MRANAFPRLLAAALLAAGLAGSAARAADPQPVDYVEELNFYNTDLHLVLKALAEKTNYPFVEDIPVEGKVTVHISKKTSIAEVLDQLLRGLNLSWKLERGVYHVQSKRPAKGAPLGKGLTAKTFALEVVSAEDAAEAVRPLLSEYGKLTVDSGLNAMTVTDVPEVLDSVQAMLDGFDKDGKQPALVNIQIKVLQIDRNGLERQGADVQWHKREAFESLGTQYLGTTLNNVKGFGHEYGAGFFNGVRQETDEYAAYMPDSLTFKVGAWGIDQIVARYYLTYTEGKVNVLSEPDVSTLHDTEATIQVGSGLPQRQAGGGNIIFFQSGITLKVKPKIGADGRIEMELHPQVTEPSGAQTFVGGSSIDWLDTRQIDTTVEVYSGDTVRIGGLLQTTRRVFEQKVPVLGDLPLLGRLFRWHTDSDSRQELVILVSPHIVEKIPPRCATTPGVSALNANLVVGTTDVLLDWSEDVPFDNVGVVRYHIYRDVRPIVATGSLTPLSREVRGDVTSWVDVSPKRRGVTYYYAATAVDGAGNEQVVSNSPSITVPRR